MINLMIILNNKAYYGTDTVIFNIYKDVEDDFPHGLVSCTFDNCGIATVAIELYNPYWSKGVHHYENEICDVLKFAEPRIKVITYIEIVKRNR